MNNVLKIALLIIGVGLIGYGIYSLLSPEVILEAEPIEVEAQNSNTQSYAMIAFGLLTLIGGLAFNRR
ncbi:MULTISPECIES: hypothetical protein [unclassified Zunongwangia]|uniref:hypothetical protein n=1 Tax=unclassified Zunongwangia TaxID=2632541 RepID=UPI0022DDFC01|nr:MULTISPECIES: hypothetical protein [unclassified Zunongwangia]WBL21831.1 hypothetical protein PBT89_14035 [Zunongwangia sp. HRR-M8]WBL26221.1 hypothetical protein PBT91_02785 [Zunongwangia sp. HGR-M22]